MSFFRKPCTLLYMQNQTTSGQNSLQQTGSNLQQNSSNLQQSGTPAVSSDVFTVLSQNSSSNGLRVQSAQTDPSLPPQTYKPVVSPVTWLVPVLFAVSVVMALILWSKVRGQQWETAEEVIQQPDPKVTETPKKAPTKPKASKKTTRRKRQAKR